MHGKMRNVHRIIVGKPEVKRLLLRPGRRCEILKRVGRQCEDWIKLVQNRIQLWAVMYTLM